MSKRAIPPPPTKFGVLSSMSQAKKPALGSRPPAPLPPPTRFGAPSGMQAKAALAPGRHVPPPPCAPAVRAPGRQGGALSGTIQRFGKTPLPFAFRYDRTSTSSTMTEEKLTGGFISRPIGSMPYWQQEPMASKIAVAKDITHSDMPTGEKRKTTQVKIMEISPNEAAKALKLTKPEYPNWEWLHMIAFSIKPTHVDSLSEESSSLLKRTGQPQQISENLVLGTSASNTEMLSWETGIKAAAKRYKLSLQLVAMPVFMKHTVDADGDEITIPVCHRMKYHFQFADQATKKVSSAFIVEFDTLSHTKPSSKSFQDILNTLESEIGNMTTVATLPLGIRTDAMEEV
jgi:hypothetical protein